MPNFVHEIQPNVQACNEILTNGSAIYLTNLEGCSKVASLATITVDTTLITAGDETASLVSNQTVTLLRANSVLKFPEGNITILEDTIISTTPLAVPIQEYTGTDIPVASTATSWGLVKVVSPTNIPFPLEATTVSRDDLSSFQTSEVKTKNSFAPSIECIASKSDTALWSVFDSARTAKDVFVVIVYSTDQVVSGRALVNSFNYDGSEGEIIRPTFTLSFQGSDYGISTTYSQASTDEKEEINATMRNAGLPEFVD